MTHFFLQNLTTSVRRTRSFTIKWLPVIAVSVFCGLHCSSLRAQFTEITEQLEAEIIMPPNVYGSAISFYDIDGNGWDDLTISARNEDPRFFLNFEGQLVPAPFEIPNNNNAHIVGMLWGDIDNDGDADLLITKRNGGVELFMNNGDLNFTNATEGAGLPEGYFKFMGAAFCDYDHDGFLDVYITKYYHPNEGGDELASVLLRNQGNGTFTDVTFTSGVYLPPRPSFQPVFLDFNGDGWEDLYIAIDRVEFPNELFRNNGNGTFTRMTDNSGADIHVCSMTATVGDYNHDSELDVYVTSNPTTDNVLLQNTGSNTFENVTGNFPGIEVGFNCWGSMWLDYDNDSWEDLFVGTMHTTSIPVGNRFFKNQNGTAFTNISNVLQINLTPSETHVCAKGDLNNDGYEDFAITNRHPLPSRVFLNDGGENNFIGVSLEGVFANRDGVGSWIHCYAGGQKYSKFTLSGENLFGQNSSKMIFGLGSISQVDSLIIKWNSGTREVYHSPEVNTHHFYVEGASFNHPFALQTSGSTTLCAGDSLVLTAADFESYIWSNGDTTQSITVTEPGEYSVVVVNEFGFSISSHTESVDLHPNSQVSFELEGVSCNGAEDGMIEVSLSSGDPDSITWNNGATTTFLNNLSAGLYSFSGIDKHGCAISGEAFVNEPSPLLAQITTLDALCFGDSSGTASVTAMGGTAPYSTNWEEQNPDSLYPGVYSATVSDANGCESELNYFIGQPDSLWVVLNTSPASGGNNGTVSAQAYGGTPPYQIDWSNGESDSFELTGLPPGEYSLTVTDTNGCPFTINFTIDNTTEVRQHPVARLWVFPNPARDAVYLTGCSSGAELTLYDVYGQPVLHRLTDQCPTNIDVAHLPAGTYLLRVREYSNNNSIRLVVSR